MSISRWRTSKGILEVVVCCLVSAPLSSLPARDEEPNREAIRDGASDESTEAAEGGISLLPVGHLFTPLLADMKEPRFSVAWRRVEFEGATAATGSESQTIDAGLVAIGATLPLWRYRAPGPGLAVELGVFGGIFSQFNLDAASLDLINTDFQGGIPVGFRWKCFSSRFRLYHQSSHLGDEFLLGNEDIDRINLSYETVDALVALEGDWWRIYGGGGWILHTSTGLDRGIAQWGAELYAPRLPWELFGNSRLHPVGGADFVAWEERDWGITSSVKAGLEWRVPGSARTLRLLAVFLDGFVPFGQFFSTEEIRSYGIEFQFTL